MAPVCGALSHGKTCHGCLPKAYQQQIDLVSADPTQAEQRLRGAWTGLTVSRLFSAYSTDAQVHRPILDGWRYALGVDHGEIAGAQAVALLCAYRGNRLHVLAEYRDSASLDYEEDARGMLQMIVSANVSPSAIDAAVGDTNKTKGRQASE